MSADVWALALVLVLLLCWGIRTGLRRASAAADVRIAEMVSDALDGPRR